MRNDSVNFFSSFQIIAFFEFSDKMSGNYTIQPIITVTTTTKERKKENKIDELVDKNSRSTYGLFVCIDAGFHG